jgi:hypothetical protein
MHAGDRGLSRGEILGIGTDCHRTTLDQVAEFRWQRSIEEENRQLARHHPTVVNAASTMRWEVGVD